MDLANFAVAPSLSRKIWHLVAYVLHIVRPQHDLPLVLDG
jgi:hypothetical protein